MYIYTTPFQYSALETNMTYENKMIAEMVLAESAKEPSRYDKKQRDLNLRDWPLAYQRSIGVNLVKRQSLR